VLRISEEQLRNSELSGGEERKKLHGKLLNLIFLSPTTCIAMKDKGSLASNLGTVEVTLRDYPRSEQIPGTAEGES
jgi:hypothetical protein